MINFIERFYTSIHNGIVWDNFIKTEDYKKAIYEVCLKSSEIINYPVFIREDYFKANPKTIEYFLLDDDNELLFITLYSYLSGREKGMKNIEEYVKLLVPTVVMVAFRKMKLKFCYDKEKVFISRYDLEKAVFVNNEGFFKEIPYNYDYEKNDIIFQNNKISKQRSNR